MDVKDSLSCSMNLAVFQGHAELGDVLSNLKKMKKQIKEAKKMGADLIVFPELFTVGYKINHDLMRELAEKRDGNTFLELSECARETGIGVLYGYPELSENGGHQLFNSVQFIDKCGNSLENYRKTHLWIEHDTSTETVFTAGDSLSNIFEFCGIRVGLLICFDVEFSEPVRALALRGAEVVLVPTAVSSAWDIKPISNVLVASRALENGIYVAYVDHSGAGGGFAGNSRCYGPEGEALITCGTEEEGIFLAEIKKVKEISHYLTKRRPELYNDVVDVKPLSSDF